MKPNPLVLLASLAGILPAVSQDGTPSSSTQAYIPGDIPDGTPPPATAPLPEFVVSPEEILASETHRQGGREITTRMITPVELAPPVVAPPSAPPDSTVQEPSPEAGAQGLDLGFLMISATVYRAPDSPPRTLVTLSPQGNGESVTFWSSADFALLTGCSSFIDAEGNSRSLMMGWESREIDHMSDLMVNPSDEGSPPQLPAIPTGRATFSIVGTVPAAETLAAVQALHDVYNNEYDRLKTAYEGREQARIAHEAELKAHPPQPKDIILNYWHPAEAGATTAAPQEGGAQ